MADLEPISNLQQQPEAFVAATYPHGSISPSASSESSSLSSSSSSSQSAGLIPIARIFRGDIGKIIIIVLMRLTMAFMTTNDAALSLPVRKFVFCSLTIGLTALLRGICPESNVPTRHAMLMDQIGAGLVLISFHGMIISFLPDYLKWIPLASVLMLLFVQCFIDF